MIYYTETKYWHQMGLMNCLSKGRDDYFEILRRIGFKCIRIPTVRPHRYLSLKERISCEYRLAFYWKNSLDRLREGDTIIIHSPNSEKFLMFAPLVKAAKIRGCKTITIVFDLELFWMSDYSKGAWIKRQVARKTEKQLFQFSDAIIVHNDVMKKKLESAGVDGSKMFSVGIMDYLRDEPLSYNRDERISLDKAVAFAGNLSIEKSSFEYDLPKGFRCNLYGSDYTGPVNEDVCYKGVFDPISLMDNMEGSFGLVWEGDSAESCTGSYGEYLTFNNPHKIALYLASGMPVIVWSKAAMAHFVRREKCGLIVDSLREVPKLLDNLSTEEYEKMRLNACRIGNEMRQGVHIRAAVESALEYVKCKAKRPALIIFTREPEAGKVKTRMMPYYTAEQCANLQKCMLRDLAGTADKIKAEGTDVIVAYTGNGRVLTDLYKGVATEYIEQRGDGLGEKMENALSDVFALGYDRAVLIGSDIPCIDESSIEEAFELLDDNDVVLGPTEDGGYYLIGMNEVHSEAFDVKSYGTGTVYEETLGSLAEAGLRVGEADDYEDLDTPEDLAEYRESMRYDDDMRKSHTGQFLSGSAKISVIIPVYNEIAEIDRMIAQISEFADECEVIFVDGGSTDGTALRIEEHIAGHQSEESALTLLHSEKSRGIQMNAGASASSGDILFFLHCDSKLPDGFLREIRRVMSHYSWGCFGVKFSSKNFFMMTNRIISNHRARRRRLPFGDQGIFIDRQLFFENGMFSEQPLMEDYEFAREMRRQGEEPGMTRRRITASARRYGKGTVSILRTELNMWKLRQLYRMGVDPASLQEKYKDIR